MTPKEKKEKDIEPLTDIIDAETLQILDQKVSKIELDLTDQKNERLIQKAEEQSLKPTEELDDIKQTTFYLDFITTIILSFLNPILEKNNIEPITTEEATDITHNLLAIASEKTLNKTGKITTAISKVINLPKILKLLTSVWKILYPRLTKYLDNKKNKVEI